jgi:hypothetical protein
MEMVVKRKRNNLAASSDSMTRLPALRIIREVKAAFGMQQHIKSRSER